MNPDNERTGAGGSRRSLAVVMVVLGVLLLLAAIAIPSFVEKRDTAQQHHCLNNLAMIDSSKEQVARVYRLTDGDSIASASVNEYIKGDTTPICPGGGTYTYNKIGEKPTCTVQAPRTHALP